MSSLFGTPGKPPVHTGDPISEPTETKEAMVAPEPLVTAKDAEVLFGKPSADVTNDNVKILMRDLRIGVLQHALKQKKLLTTAMGITAIAGLIKDQEQAIQKEESFKNNLEVAAVNGGAMRETMLEVFKSTPVWRGTPISPEAKTEELYKPEPVPMGDTEFKPGEAELGKAAETHEEFIRRMNAD